MVSPSGIAVPRACKVPVTRIVFTSAAAPLNVPDVFDSVEVPEPVSVSVWPFPEPVPVTLNGVDFASLSRLTMAAASGKVVAALVLGGAVLEAGESEPPPPQAASANADTVAAA